MKTRYLILSLMVLIQYSCSDFLNEEPTGSLTTDANLTSMESAASLANSAYADIDKLQNTSVGWGSTTYMMLEFMTGKCGSSVAHSRFEDFKNLSLDSRALFIDVWWRNSYYGISKCNLALAKLEEFTTIPQVDLSRMKGEVRFMRALYYFNLVRIFGDIPFVINVQSSIFDLVIERSPIKKIYDEIIIPDLLLAEKSTLPKTDNTGRASMGAVKTLLSDVYLTYAGFPVEGGDNFYKLAAEKANEVISWNIYSLFPKYEDLRSPTNNNRNEFIFSVQMSLDKRHNELIPLFIPQQLGLSVYPYEFGGVYPTNEFYNSFSDADLRKQERQFFYTWYPGYPSKHPEGSSKLERIDFGAPYIYKFFDESATLETAKSLLNIPIYRYADLLLIYAEAQNEVAGLDENTYNCINAVRRRAQLPDLSGLTKDEFRRAVWDERYFELCFENKTWFDMVRTRKVRNDITGRYEDFLGYKTVYDKTFSATNLLFPIPQYELETNPKLIQNQGY